MALTATIWKTSGLNSLEPVKQGCPRRLKTQQWPKHSLTGEVVPVTALNGNFTSVNSIQP